MDNLKIKDLIDEFKSGLIAKATNGDLDEREYKRCRDILLKVPELKEHIPSFIKSNHTARDFRSYMQGKEQHYADRRRVISEQMNSLAELLEIDTDPFMKMQAYEKRMKLVVADMVRYIDIITNVLIWILQLKCMIPFSFHWKNRLKEKKDFLEKQR